MIKIALIEDDVIDKNSIKSYLKRYSDEFGVEFSVFEFANAITFLTNYKPIYDVVFMDIQLPHMNGFDAIERLRKIDEKIHVVFITNMSNYAIKGYSVNATDFMVKPVLYYSFKTMLDKILRLLKSNKEEIIIKTPTSIRRLSVSEIIFVEVTGHKVVYHTETEDIEIWESLKEQEEKLSSHGFVRCNNYCLVNLRYVDKISATTLKIKDIEMPITRTKKEDFMKKLVAYYGSKF